MRLLTNRRAFLAGLTAGAALASNAVALEAISGRPILTLSGNIGAHNAADAAQFDMAAFENMGMTSIRTNTPWTDGAATFEGVLLSDVLRSVEAEGGTLRLVALNDYSVEMPIDVVARFNPLLAVKRDGKVLSRRSKGPVFLIFDFDAIGSLQDIKLESLAVWQLKEVIVR